tara:strand:+ start:2428 stop:2754 length:327 start_codon:yes stop_codon:yes gene_type:complete
MSKHRGRRASATPFKLNPDAPEFKPAIPKPSGDNNAATDDEWTENLAELSRRVALEKQEEDARARAAAAAEEARAAEERAALWSHFGGEPKSTATKARARKAAAKKTR